MVLLFILVMTGENSVAAGLLDADDYEHYVEYFNTMEQEEPTPGIIRNARSWEWMVENIPLFECPDEEFEQIYYYRWWCYRKHIKYPTNYGYIGYIVTEWINWDNPNSSPFSHHIAEGRWLHNQDYLDQYVHFFYRANYGQPDTRFHNYSNWATDALYKRYLVTMDADYLVDLLDDLVEDYQQWESTNQRPDGMFWSYDVRDSMEDSISGADDDTGIKNVRPTLNSYMAANAKALAKIAQMAGRTDIADTYQTKFDSLRSMMIDAMWDDTAKFFVVRYESGGLCDAREAIGFIPWMFDLPGPEHAQAWSQLADPDGFWAPAGLTTAERRHPLFRTHGTGNGCEWDGPVWPFATSQTLTAMANMLCGDGPYYATSRDYFDSMMIYAQSHQMFSKPYLGEYMDEITGEWLKGPDSERSRYYNHSTFCDLVISGLVGLKPREDSVVEVVPLVPQDSWDWFCLDRVPYHERLLTIVWDRDGGHYGNQAGLCVYCDGQLIADSAQLTRVTGMLTDPDYEAPTPNPMTWRSAPNAVDEQTITMTATEAADVSGVQYYFANITDPSHDSGWQNGNVYTDTLLLPGTSYTYTVTARDSSFGRNETAASNAESAVTEADTTPPSPETVIWSVAPYSVGNTISMTATACDDISGVEYYFVNQTQRSHDSGWQQSNVYTDTGLLPNTSYTYTVIARDLSVNRNRTDYSFVESATTGDVVATTTVSINFQPESAEIPDGYLADYGQTYGDRGDGYVYGWNINHTDTPRKRNVNSDQRLDTIIHYHQGGAWEMEADNGEYQVEVTVGDPSYSEFYTINVEGVNYWDAVALSPNVFLTLQKTVLVSDGRISIDQGSAAEKDTRICYVKITSTAEVPFECTAPIAMDLDDDCTVDIKDFGIFAESWMEDANSIGYDYDDLNQLSIDWLTSTKVDAGQ